MKKELNEYLNELTSGDMDIFEEIISRQYRKFTEFYKIVSKYSDYIDKIKYEFKSSSSLDVLVILNATGKKKIDTIFYNMEKNINKSKYSGKIDLNKKNISISIYLDENT